MRRVVVGHSGALTQRERWLVGLAFGGEDSCLSHHSALLLWGARAQELAAGRRVAGVLGDYRAHPDAGLVEISRPHERHMSSHGRDIDHVISDVLPGGLATVDELVREAQRAGRLAGPGLRAALADARRGLRSVGELVA